jgi:ribosome biogenesis GTPase / thiamine phosphate phosphatase
VQLEALGYGPWFSDSFRSIPEQRADLIPARVISHLGAYVVIDGAPPSHRAELSGRLRHELALVDRPTVGDWVAIAPGSPAIIHRVLPRRTALVRRAAGTRGEHQAVVANVDLVVVVTSANRDANPRRLERYLAAIRDSGAAAAIAINKIDLCSADELAEVAAALEPAVRGVPIAAISAATGAGLAELTGLLRPRETVVLVGMSGVGKSSLVNRLAGDARQAVLPIDDDDRGRHATSRRDLVALPGGGLLIDTPGMRSFGLVDDDGGLADEFAEIHEAAAQCRFRDCRHEGEPGCAVAAAIDEGRLDGERLVSLRKLDREAAAARRRGDPGATSRAKRQWRTVHMAMRARKKVDPKLGG